MPLSIPIARRSRSYRIERENDPCREPPAVRSTATRQDASSTLGRTDELMQEIDAVIPQWPIK
ncbi:MAG: hypothetical protein KAU94_04565 [Verrucomicrobia bacterium]|nr:hypothetical protein [Verrucomicrobiota bacterium]